MTERKPSNAGSGEQRPSISALNIVAMSALLAMVAVTFLTPRDSAERSGAADPSAALAQAEAAYRGGDDALALQGFKPMAENGNAEAQYWLARMYEQGDIDGQPEIPNAVTWYQKAADAGLTEAKVRLGHLYLEGVGVLQDFAKARPLLEGAADDGSAKAQFDLGRMREHGWGVEKSLPMAYAWYEYATRQDDPPALKARDRLLDELAPDQIIEGQKLLASLDPGIAGADQTSPEPPPR